MKMTINHPCGKVTIKELENDVLASRKKELMYAFAADTVEALINHIKALASELNGIAEDDMTIAEKRILEILLNGV